MSGSHCRLPFTASPPQDRSGEFSCPCFVPPPPPILLLHSTKLCFHMCDTATLATTSCVTTATTNTNMNPSFILSHVHWPPRHSSQVRVLFTYLHDLAASQANDANVVHLMIIFAPLFCRPDQTAHMSIRHGRV